MVEADNGRKEILKDASDEGGTCLPKLVMFKHVEDLLPLAMGYMEDLDNECLPKKIPKNKMMMFPFLIN